MIYFPYLKKSFPLYTVSGVILACAIFALSMARQYNDHLSQALSDLQGLNIKIVKIKEEIREIDTVLGKIRDSYQIDLKNTDHDALMFQSLDKLKSRFSDATIRIGKFDKSGGSRKLPLEIRAPMKDYSMILDYVGYIESFRIPAVEIDQVSISREEAGGIVFYIKGAFVMPDLGNPAQEEPAYG